MRVECPHCGKQLNLKQVKSGRFKPKCSKCGESFRLTISKDPGKDPLIEPIGEVRKSADTVTDVNKTSGSAAPDATATPPDDQAAQTMGVDQTIAAQPPSSSRTGSQPTAGAESQKTDSGPAESGQTDTSQTDKGAADDEVNSTAVMESAPATRANLADQTAVTERPDAPAHPNAGALLRLGQTIGGYRVEKELGRGAMGAVYLANQLSLDRLVGMKVIQPRFAADPIFIARFTREAYAAAQISHHNVVQIIDLGCEQDIHYFTMEYVRGETLDELIRERGKLDAEAAVGFILQAARGLQHAHNLGMVHRDIKPANLMLSETGAVKVADLGLVKMLRADEGEAAESKSHQGSDRQSRLADVAGDVTDPNLSMGTPLFMAPEQGESATNVDHRADIYSLGCTFYVMLTGKPPFSGTSALEVITKHKSEPVTPPEIVVKRIPSALSDIVMRMVAKSPAERYGNLGEVIADLEEFLGVKSGEPYSPDEDDANELERAVGEFNQSKFAKLRGMVVPAAILAPLALSLICLVFSWGLSLGFAAMSATASISYFAIGGLRDRTYLFDKVRLALLGARITDWLMWAGGGLLTLLVFYVVGVLLPVVVLGLLGVAVGGALHFVLDGMVRKERAESLHKVEALCRRLRLQGVEEDSLQQFVAKYSGNHWEEMFEAVFGYEAKLNARRVLAKTEVGRRASKYRAWRDPVIRRLDERLQQAQESNQLGHLQQVEEANLRAQGVDQVAAREQSQRMAEALVDEAVGLRQAPVASSSAVTVVDPAAQRAEKRAKQKAMLAEARSGKYSRKKAPLSGLLNLVLGSRVRFLLGCALLAGGVLWAQQNGYFSQEQIQDAAAKTLENNLGGAAETLSGGDAKSTEPLSLPLVGWLFNSINPVVIGLMLIFSSFFRGWKMSIFALPAAAIGVLGPGLGVPGGPWVSLAGGLVVGAVGLVFGRTPAED